nr:hypothetical protein [Paracoccus isoporae]
MLHVNFGAVDGAGYGDGRVMKMLPRRRRHCAARGPVEDGLFQPRFQIHEMVGDNRRRVAFLFGCAVYAVSVGNCLKNADLAEVQMQALRILVIG